MRWSDTIELIPDSVGVDEYRQPLDPPSNGKVVFANKKSVRQSEFYQALAVGLKPDLVFEIRVVEYADEKRAKYGGTTYYIVRTFSKNDEIMELICSRYPMGG